MEAPAYAQQFESARQRLQDKGLLMAGSRLSCRVPGTGTYLIGSHGGDGVRELPLEAAGESAKDLHRLIYLARPDVGAILLGRQPWASSLPTAGAVMPGIFDEQLRHLGWSVRPVEGLSNLEAARDQLADGANAYTLDDQAICLGMTLERLVFNAELLEKCAKAWLLASASGMPVGKIPWLVRWIATGRLRKDQKRAADHHERGLAPPRSAGY